MLISDFSEKCKDQPNDSRFSLLHSHNPYNTITLLLLSFWIQKECNLPSLLLPSPPSLHFNFKNSKTQSKHTTLLKSTQSNHTSLSKSVQSSSKKLKELEWKEKERKGSHWSYLAWRGRITETLNGSWGKCRLPQCFILLPKAPQTLHLSFSSSGFSQSSTQEPHFRNWILNNS